MCHSPLDAAIVNAKELMAITESCMPTCSVILHTMPSEYLYISSASEFQSSISSSIPIHSFSQSLYLNSLVSFGLFKMKAMFVQDLFFTFILIHSVAARSSCGPTDCTGNLGIQYGHCYTMTDVNGLHFNRVSDNGVYQSGGDVDNLIFKIRRFQVHSKRRF